MPAREYFSRVSPKGQITLPAEVRKELNIRPKDSVAIELDKGVIRIKRKPKLQDFYQVIPALHPPKSWDEIERTAHEDHAEHAANKGLP